MLGNEKSAVGGRGIVGIDGTEFGAVDFAPLATRTSPPPNWCRQFGRRARLEGAGAANEPDVDTAYLIAGRLRNVRVPLGAEVVAGGFAVLGVVEGHL